MSLKPRTILVTQISAAACNALAALGLAVKGVEFTMPVPDRS